jgi:hypothetical protein
MRDGRRDDLAVERFANRIAGCESVLRRGMRVIRGEVGGLAVAAARSGLCMLAGKPDGRRGSALAVAAARSGLCMLAGKPDGRRGSAPRIDGEDGQRGLVVWIGDEG